MVNRITFLYFAGVLTETPAKIEELGGFVKLIKDLLIRPAKGSAK